MLASLLAFLAGQTINSWIMVRMKARSGEKSLWARIMGSSVAGEFVDTLIFCSIAASVIGITDAATFVNYVVVGFVYKTLVEFILVPVTSLVIRWVKKREPSYGGPVAAVTNAA